MKSLVPANFGENDLVRVALSNDSSLVDLGQHRLRDVAEMEHVFQLAHPELRSDFPPLTTSARTPECEISYISVLTSVTNPLSYRK